MKKRDLGHNVCIMSVEWDYNRLALDVTASLARVELALPDALDFTGGSTNIMKTHNTRRLHLGLLCSAFRLAWLAPSSTKLRSGVP